MLVVFCKPELMGHEDGSGLALGARQSKLGPFGIATSPMLHTPAVKEPKLRHRSKRHFPNVAECGLHAAHRTLQNGLSFASHQKVHNYNSAVQSAMPISAQTEIPTVYFKALQHSPFKYRP